MLKITNANDYRVRKEISNFLLEQVHQQHAHIVVVNRLMMGSLAYIKLSDGQIVPNKEDPDLESNITAMLLCPVCG